LPTLAKDADPLEQFNSLKTLNEVSAQVWTEHEKCQEPISKPISEAVLHFKSGKFNEYEGNEETGYAQIYKYVEQYIESHNQIYVIGHTDIRKDDAYNYQLSYDRALEVSTKIEKYLSSRDKKRGRDYQIHAIGMGKSQLLDPKPGETENEWLTRCRRLKLEFRRLSRTNEQANLE
jgi:outer membrane protein OmpA-like peptidoglycan-associated protein